MTNEEIFNKLASHMIEGIMIHDEMSRAYSFLGLEGFSLCHNSHHIEETHNYMHLCQYYSNHYHKLIELEEIPQPKIIPAAWNKYTTMDVDINTKREAVQAMMEKWVTWERDTKKLYQEMYQALWANGEIASVQKISCFICDVDKELEHAEKKWIQLKTVNYDINTIFHYEDAMKKKYKE